MKALLLFSISLTLISLICPDCIGQYLFSDEDDVWNADFIDIFPCLTNDRKDAFICWDEWSYYDSLKSDLSMDPSKPAITDMIRDHDTGNMIITWDSELNMTYRIESSTSPYDYDESLMVWTDEVTGLASGGATTLWTDTNVPTVAPAEKYYRLYAEFAEGDDIKADDTLGLMVFTAYNGRNLISSPFEPYPEGGGTPGESTLDKIIGSQVTAHFFNPSFSDNIERWDKSIGRYARTWAKSISGIVVWQNAFPFKADEGYWYNIVMTHPDRDLILFGRVSPSDRSVDINVSSNSNRNLIGTCFPKASSLLTCGLLESGFTGHPFNPGFSDQVEFWDGSAYNRYWFKTGTTNAWQPSDRVINPCESFWLIRNMNRPGFTWDYPKP